MKEIRNAARSLFTVFTVHAQLGNHVLFYVPVLANVFCYALKSIYFFFFFFTKRVRTFSVFYKVRASSAPWAVCGGLLKSKTNPNAAAD